MPWRILQGAEADLGLQIQLYGHAVIGAQSQELLLVGKGPDFGPDSKSYLFSKTWRMAAFTPAGGVLSYYERTHSPGEAYVLEQLSLQGEDGQHDLLRTTHQRSGAVQWLYDGVKVTLIAVSLPLYFDANPEITAIRVVRGNVPRPD